MEVCQSCSKGYELPRRFHIKEDDMEYLCLPRLLNCLHTMCTSCSEESFQRTKGKITCSVCRRTQTCRGVRYVPLDVSILQGLCESGGMSVMASCSRCHDEVPSFSWCFTCDCSLCEFHHQDHKLSINTKKHEVITFREILHENLKISPLVPPIACPDILETDSSLLCKTCGHVISAQGLCNLHTI